MVTLCAGLLDYETGTMRLAAGRFRPWDWRAKAGRIVRMTAGVAGFLLLANAVVPPSSAQSAQSPLSHGSTEWSFRTGAGMGSAGGFSGSNFWAAHARWGRVLTAPHGPGFLRGSLEYAFEVVPALLLFQEETVYGGGITPLLFQYNFATSGRVVPYIEVGGGMLFSTEQVPPGTSRFNFTPQGGLGVYWFRGPRAAALFGVRYHHISNASTAERNPGHNALYLHAGFSCWR